MAKKDMPKIGANVNIQQQAGILEFGAKFEGAEQKAQRMREYRREASRKVSLANKRIKRLENNNLTDSPAYQRLVRDGVPKFSVKGKSWNELQSEVKRLERFISSETSTVRGVESTLKQMAKNTGIKYKNLTELRTKSSKFFELASKVEQYLRNVEDRASSIGYQKIWEAVNVYTKQEKVDLGDADTDIDSMVEAVTKAIDEYDKPGKGTIGGSTQGGMNKSFEWFMLKDK